MPAIEFSDLLVSLHIKLSIKVALEFEILVGRVIRGKNPLATSISKKSLTKSFSLILSKSNWSTNWLEPCHNREKKTHKKQQNDFL